ncbi:MAG TPA: zinc ribbon domain-containing protein [Opitutaceae bacterium]|nr:zinc ribbon domain-containing protein [Opitutaceae bacterium]
MSQDDFTPPGECPVCGEDVPAGARSCPACGADERTGWDDEATRYDALDLPDEAFDEEINRPPRKRWHQSALWVGVALVLVILLIVAVV